MKKSLEEIAAYYIERFGFDFEHLESIPDKRTKMIIVIPVYNEPTVTETLDSLSNCARPSGPVEVILVVNNSGEAQNSVQEQNLKAIADINSWIEKNPNRPINCHLMSAMNLPPKHAGVGLARKIGMDEALRRFASLNYNGLIVCLDADCAVQPNYLMELDMNFAKEDFRAGNIYYEHPFNGEESKETRSGIIQYELGLRYYVNALRYAGYPCAFHTIGSSMAVSAKTYALAGGMNKRKAGEDFYFLHKLIPHGGFQELNATTVYPSSRVSERVPFGTGRAMLKWEEQIAINQNSDMQTYNLKTFRDLKKFIASIPKFASYTGERQYAEGTGQLPESIQAFLQEQDFYSVLLESIKQTAGENTFSKRIFTWLDGFRVLKFVHFARDRYYSNVPVEKCVLNLLNQLDIAVPRNGPIDLLATMRKLDRGN
ncbi:MAG: glycosyltransferase family 2 protein [Flavobacteriales bacterium]|nr:glycosyltransferase family 2 protein [Flavobacteriales bacterium]